MVVFNHMMEITLPATIFLQGKTIDILLGMNLKIASKDLSSNMWHNIDDYHEKWYKEAILIAGKQNLLEKAPKDFVQSKQTEQTSHQVLQVNTTKGHSQFQ